MNRCPPEILTTIFDVACADDGYTGRSLSLVSHQFHHASLPVQLKSVAVYGFAHMESFASLLEERPSHLRKVRHLLLTKLDRSYYLAISANETETKDMALKVWHSYSDKENYVQRGYPLVLRILSAVQSTLSTLALLFPDSYAYRHIPFIPVQLPNLNELIVDGGVDEESLSLSLAAPTLERLDIVTHWQLPTDFTTSLRRIAPKLTHLRVGSILDFRDYAGPIDAFKTAVHLWTGISHPETEDQCWLFNLHKIIVARAIVEPDGPGGIAAISFHSITAVLNKLSEEDQSGKLVLLAPPRPIYEEYMGEHAVKVVREAWEAWMGRVNGREERWCVRNIAPCLQGSG